jgi:hypothetical protein
MVIGPLRPPHIGYGFSYLSCKVESIISPLLIFRVAKLLFWSTKSPGDWFQKVLILNGVVGIFDVEGLVTSKDT